MHKKCAQIDVTVENGIFQTCHGGERHCARQTKPTFVFRDGKHVLIAQASFERKKKTGRLHNPLEIVSKLKIVRIVVSVLLKFSNTFAIHEELETVERAGHALYVLGESDSIRLNTYHEIFI